MKKVTIASSQFPSGVAWLLNVFLELNIAVYRGRSINDTWDISTEGCALKNNQEILKQWCPIFLRKTTFNFSDDIQIEWTHRFPQVEDENHKTILFLRDGRDAIYSQFKREKNEPNLISMLESPTPPFNFTPSFTWALHSYVWSYFIPKNHLQIIKFEDTKNNPYQVVEKLLNFLNIVRSHEEILTAIGNSTFEQAKKAEQEFRKNAKTTQFETVNRKGQLGEWKVNYQEEHLNAFKGFPEMILHKFGYEIACALSEDDQILLNPKELGFINLMRERNEHVKKLNLCNDIQSDIDLSLWLVAYELITITNIESTILSCAGIKLFSIYLTFAEQQKNSENILFKIMEALIEKKLWKNFKRLKTLLINTRLLPMHNQILAIVCAKKLNFLEVSSFSKRSKSTRAIIVEISNNYKKILKGRIKQLIRPFYHLIKKVFFSFSGSIFRKKMPKKTDPSKIMIHLGCGLQNDPRWINVDLLKLPHIDYIHNITNLDIFPSNYADILYASHVLEHISYKQLNTVLKEWFRILKPDGKLWILVPDFEQLLKIYLDENHDIEAIQSPLMGGQNYQYNFHYSVFNRKFIIKKLLQAGFSKINDFDPLSYPEHTFNDFSRIKYLYNNVEYNINLQIEAIK